MLNFDLGWLSPLKKTHSMLFVWFQVGSEVYVYLDAELELYLKKVSKSIYKLCTYSKEMY